MTWPLGVLLMLYFVCETAFAALAKTLSDPLGTLPTATATATLAWWTYVVVSGQSNRIRVTRDVALAGVGGAAVLLSLTCAYSLPGISIVLPLLLMKGGGQFVAPAMSASQGEPISRRSLLVLALALTGVVAAMWSRLRVDGTAAAGACAVVYLGGYAVKLGSIGRHRGDWSFFLSMTSVTLAFAVPLSFLACALGGAQPSGSTLAFLAGIASQGCGVFGGIFLMRGTAPEDKARGLTSHAALFPLHRSASLLAGMTAMVILASLRWGSGLWAHRGEIFASGEPIGALCMVLALWLGTRGGSPPAAPHVVDVRPLPRAPLVIVDGVA